MAYDFFLGDLQLPLAPAKLKIKIKNKNETITLLNEGEVNLLKTPGLTDVEFEFLVPQVSYPFAEKVEASSVLGALERMKTGLEPFQFIVSRVLPSGAQLFETDMTVSLEEYSVTEDAENGFDLLVSVELKQYREFGTKKATLKTDKNGKNPRLLVENNRPSSRKKTEYTVRDGDTLMTVGKAALDDTDPKTLKRIADKNGIQDPFKLKPGEVVKIG